MAVTNHFNVEPGGTVAVRRRFEDPDTRMVGHSTIVVRPGDSFFNLTHDQLRDAGAGEIVFADDGRTASIRQPSPT